MLNMLEVGKVGEALVVGLQYRGRFNSLDTILRKIWRHLVKDECRKPFILIVGAHRYKQQVEVGHLLRTQRLDKVIPTKRE